METFKQYWFSILITLMLALAAITLSCSNTEEPPIDEGCIDESLIDLGAYCYALYDPVCGCDDVTYSNDCHADIAGVTTYTKGKCN